MADPPISLANPSLSHQVAYKAGNEHSVHQYTISKDEPFFLQARANAAQLSEVPPEDVGCAPLCLYSRSSNPPATLLVSSSTTVYLVFPEDLVPDHCFREEENNFPGNGGQGS